MVWQGKALGALVGMFAGPVGALVGAFVGHWFDVQAENAFSSSTASRTSSPGVQQAFFNATFQVMGHLAKADGRVSEEEIRAARAMMNELRLGEREVQLAIDLFSQGKAQEFPLGETLQEVRRTFGHRPDLCRMFVQIQVQAALWGGSMHAPGRKVLTRVCASLDISAYELVQMEALLRMQQSMRQPSARPAVDRTAEACEVLGVPRTASDAEVTKAYRRLMNQNHPDKLVAKGLPESMMKVAEEKTRQIRTAYEVLRDARGMR